MHRSLFLVATLLTGCLPTWAPLTDTEPSSGLADSTACAPHDSGESPEIPEQAVRSDWLAGRVTDVPDGNTLVLLVLDQHVRVLSIGEDRHGRLLGRTYLEIDEEPIDVNRFLVFEGLAWHYKRYSDDEDLSEAELDARGERRGLWREPDPIAPWEWHANARAEPAEQPELGADRPKPS